MSYPIPPLYVSETVASVGQHLSEETVELLQAKVVSIANEILSIGVIELPELTTNLRIAYLRGQLEAYTALIQMATST